MSTLALGAIVGGYGASASVPLPTSVTWQHELRLRLTIWPSWSYFAAYNGVVVFLVLLGRATAGILSVLLIFITGYSIGFETTRAFSRGYTSAAVATLLIPHGVAELTGLLIAGTWALQGFGMLIGETAKVRVTNTRLPAIALLLVAAAAWLEANLTPYCVRLLMHLEQ